MKVPYLKKTINDEFITYLDELSQSVNNNIDEARTLDEPRVLYGYLYPLFALLQELSNTQYFRNPSREIILSEFQRDMNKNKFISVIKEYNKREKHVDQLSVGIQRNTFTAYFNELYSDTLLLLNSFSTYNYRGSQIAMRCMLEDLYRHLYYRDHPEEFLSQKIIKPAELREYLTQTSYLSLFNKLNDNFSELKGKEANTLFARNEELYSECSSYVHGSNSGTMNSFKINSDFKYDEKQSQKILKSVSKFVGMSVAFLTAAHLDHFLAFNDYEKSIVLEAYNNKDRAAFRIAMNV